MVSLKPGSHLCDISISISTSFRVVIYELKRRDQTHATFQHNILQHCTRLANLLQGVAACRF